LEVLLRDHVLAVDGAAAQLDEEHAREVVDVRPDAARTVARSRVVDVMPRLE
jgi:hypothetical protein